MPDGSQTKADMGDLIGSTRERIATQTPGGDTTAKLQALVAATATPKPKPPVAPAPEPISAEPPRNYFPQVPATTGITPKRTPKKGPTRALSMTMRVSAPERDRLVRWCDERNLSLADGVMALLDIAEGQGERS